MTASEPRLVWDLQAELGEGPIWVERDKALWFTDIKRKQIHRYDPASEQRRSWESPEQVGFVLPARSGGFIAGLQSGLHHFDPQTGEFESIVEVEPDRPTNRLNDGVVDRQGRLWFGTMDNGEGEGTGSFYCFHKGELKKTRIGGICITNGPAISPDGRTLYWVDTLGGGIYACDIADDGSLSESREFLSIGGAEGHPDGPTTDSDGNVWISLYAGWEVRCYSPAAKLVETVRFPVANITKIAFGGDDMRTAFATTARQKLTPEEIAPQPEIGGLFSFRAQVGGFPCPLVDDQ